MVACRRDSYSWFFLLEQQLFSLCRKWLNGFSFTLWNWQPKSEKINFKMTAKKLYSSFLTDFGETIYKYLNERTLIYSKWCILYYTLTWIDAMKEIDGPTMEPWGPLRVWHRWFSLTLLCVVRFQLHSFVEKRVTCSSIRLISSEKQGRWQRQVLLMRQLLTRKGRGTETSFIIPFRDLTYILMAD